MGLLSALVDGEPDERYANGKQSSSSSSSSSCPSSLLSSTGFRVGLVLGVVAGATAAALFLRDTKVSDRQVSV